MKSHRTAAFRKAFEKLPDEVQRHARETYRLWLKSPNHQSLKYRRIHSAQSIYTIRIGLHWRALATQVDDVVIWFWIGSHSDYDKLLEAL